MRIHRRDKVFLGAGLLVFFGVFPILGGEEPVKVPGMVLVPENEGAKVITRRAFLMGGGKGGENFHLEEPNGRVEEKRGLKVNREVLLMIRNDRPIWEITPLLNDESDGSTPIIYARMSVLAGRMDVVEYIVFSSGVGMAQNDLNQLLFYAVSSGDQNIFERLVSIGANPHVKKENGFGLLEQAVSQNRSVLFIERLIGMGVTFDDELIDKYKAHSESFREKIGEIEKEGLY